MRVLASIDMGYRNILPITSLPYWKLSSLYNCILLKSSNYCENLWGIHGYMLSCFSHFQFFATSWTIAHQAPLSMWFFRQEYWGAMSSSRESSWPRNQVCISNIGTWILYHWATGEAPLRFTLCGKYLEVLNVNAFIWGFPVHIHTTLFLLEPSNNDMIHLLCLKSQSHWRSR